MKKSKKLAALAFLIIHFVSVFYPGVSYALTSGPSAPESSQFQASSVTDLVDPFSGDFNYNIPLLDVDGYPINMAYTSGGGMDDEASFVGYGWNINSGSVSRIMKGIPDDFNGTDKIVKEYNIRPDITGGVSFNASTEIFGLDFLGANASADIYYNNQRGLGVELGAGISATLNTAKFAAGEYTGGLTAGANLGITSNSQTGADFNFGANMGISMKDKENASGALGLRFGGSLNSRAGLKSTTLGASFNTSKSESDIHKIIRLIVSGITGRTIQAPGSTSASLSLGSTTTSYGMAFTPTITMPMKNESYSLSPQAGPEFWGFHAPTIQLTGHYSIQKLAVSRKEFPAYGFLHAVNGRTNPEALLDFNREKDVPYMESTPTLSVPYVTQDIFTATSHLGSSQFKAFSNSSGVFFDSYASNTSDAFSLGIEFGGGVGVKGGVDLSSSGSSTVTRKWTGNNDFLQNGDFSPAAGADGEDAYFKLVGEKSSINKEYLNKIADRIPVKVMTDDVDDQPKAFSTLAANNASYPVAAKIARNKREPRGEVFSPLTADQATHFALDKQIRNYAPLMPDAGIACNNGVFGNYSGLSRVSATHKPHHISEIKLTKNDGMRLFYGVPVYNNQQVDVTMSVSATAAHITGDPHLVKYENEDNSTGNSRGTDHYFSKETIPAYATNYLLSGICTPDYVDVTGNGISDDDLGSAVKFNYTLVNGTYQWRTPNVKNQFNYANFSEGNKSQTDDNKASISYGNKELWYPHSIESKNMIAVFRLGERNDGYGYNPNGSIDPLSKQKKLERIDLYTKAELLKNPADPTPIKSVHFEYDYSLFGNVPNNITGGGKLTLTSVYFTYGKSTSGDENRYYFKYNPSGDFQAQQYDRWGTYKDKSWNNSIAGIDLDNNDFPYSVQNKTKADEAVQKWQLSEIELPSGGKIKIDYESDDYAYVQDKRAMQVAEIVGYGHYNPANPSGNFSNYEETDKVYIKLPAASTNEKVKWEYFDGVDQLYFKTMIRLVKDKSSDELVSGYAKINDVKVVQDAQGYYTVAEVTLEKRGKYHPVAAAGWQFLRSNLPKLAYPYSVDDGLSPLNFVKALISAIRNVGELVTPFESRAMRQGFASAIIPDKGFTRITSKWMKYGGGLRVKRIIMDDIWSEMAGPGNGASTTTGMEFGYSKKYKTPDGNEIDISTGVASYEPMAGGEENPFRQPISYQQKAHLTSSIYTVEEPLGESYFPAASVGYSQVTIKNLDADGNVVSNGYTVKKFYTAKDFPTVVKRTDLSKNKYNQSSIFGLFNIDQGNSVVLSQGFYVENNDMHGKALSDETFDGTGKVIAGSYYHYKSSGTEQMALENTVPTLQPDGTVKNETVGEEFEMYHDMREQVTENSGVSINVNLDILFFLIIVVPIPTFIPIIQNSHSGYEAASTIKVINRYAILDKVTTIENGSTMSSENALWDAMTGQVLMTKTQNGFDDPLYSFTLPAYMVNEYEKGMGAAYRNTGIVFNSVTVSNGQLPASMNAFIVPGDELGISGTNQTVWAMNIASTRNAAPVMRLINKDGSMYSGNGSLLLLRSGRRNMMGASAYSIVSLKNPIHNGKIEINQGTEILSSSAGTFSDEWSAETKNTSCINWPQGGRAARSAVVENNPNNLTKPVSVKDIIADQNSRPAIQNNLQRPMSVNELLHNNKKQERASGPSDNLSCDPCGNIGDFIFNADPIYADGDPCLTITYNCAEPFPDNKQVVFNLSSTCTEGYITHQIIIDKNHLTGTMCFGARGRECTDITLNSWYCENIYAPCSELGAYTITEEKGLNGDCVRIKYTASNPFPTGKAVHFQFSNICNGVLKTGTAILTANAPEATICGIGDFDCAAGTLSLDSWFCTDDTGCEPCAPASYSIDKTYGSPKDCGKIRINAAYLCPAGFPPGVSATLSFSYLCNGTVCETKTMTIDSEHPSRELCFFGWGTISACSCATDINSIRFNGISGTACNQTPGCCPPPIDQKINPYYTGLKGNWRGKQTYVYTTGRDTRPDPINTSKLPTNTRKGGIFSAFTSFYKVEQGKFVSIVSNQNAIGMDKETDYILSDPKWIASATVTKINSKGQELENKDALDKYSAAQFGFNELVATAVAANARNSEMAYDGFEDYGYNNSCGAYPANGTCSEDGHFNFRKALRLAGGTGFTLVNTEAHTGNYSVLVNAGITDAFTRRDLVYNLDDLEKYTFNASGEMILKKGGMIETFKPCISTPQAVKKYIVSGWIKGEVATASDPGNTGKAKIIIEAWNEGSIAEYYSVTAAKAGPKVEGWTRVLAVFEIPSQGTTSGDYLKIRLVPGSSNTWFDDIRIHPYDGNMKSFVYDYRTFRLMAELDENNYATFFEYSDEGQLLRTKKETENGIVTLKETRSRVHKNKRN